MAQNEDTAKTPAEGQATSAGVLWTSWRVLCARVTCKTWEEQLCVGNTTVLTKLSVDCDRKDETNKMTIKQQFPIL